MNQSFPSDFDAPAELTELAPDAACGPVAAWQVLEYFRRDFPPTSILRGCRFDAEIGTYAIGLAVALAQAGLQVEFSTDPDPNPNHVERELYAQAEALGVRTTPGQTAMELSARLDAGRVAIVLFQLEPGVPHGHFSPLLAGVAGEPAYLPNESVTLGLSELEALRRAPGLFRQCVIASFVVAT